MVRVNLWSDMTDAEKLYVVWVFLLCLVAMGSQSLDARGGSMWSTTVPALLVSVIPKILYKVNENSVREETCS